MVMMTCSQTLTQITSGNRLLMLGKVKHLVDIVNIPTITSQRWLKSQMQYIDKFRHICQISQDTSGMFKYHPQENVEIGIKSQHPVWLIEFPNIPNIPQYFWG